MKLSMTQNMIYRCDGRNVKPFNSDIFFMHTTLLMPSNAEIASLVLKCSYRGSAQST